MRIRMQKIDGGYDCHIRIGEMTIGAASDTAASALSAASGLAHDLTTQMVAHPELAALLPPQAVVALKEIRIAAWAAKHGRLPDVAAKIGPAAVKVVSSVLRRLF